MSLKAGEFNMKTATLGKSVPSPRKLNTRQYPYAFSDLNTSVLSIANYKLIEQPGFAFGLNPASDYGVAIVHVNQPGNPVYITPGTPKDIPEGFERLYLERATKTPSRADLLFVFDVSDRVGGVQYGPLQPGAANVGADDYTSPARKTITTVLGGAAAFPTELLPAQAGRRKVTVQNVSTAGEIVYLVLENTNQAWVVGSTGIILELAPGSDFTLEYTGGVYAIASAATALARVFQLK